MQTPISSLATPPFQEKLGEQAGRRLFVSPRSRASLERFVRQLDFSESKSETSRFATSTPVALEITITLGSSPWENAQLPSLQGPRAQEVLDASTPGWRDQVLAVLRRPNTPMSKDSPTPDPSPLPRQVCHILRGNVERPIKVLVTKFTTYEIISQWFTLKIKCLK